MTQHTPGAIKAATIIMGDEEYIFTTYGTKTHKGIADLIDNETAAPELLEVLENIIRYAHEGATYDNVALPPIRQAIAKAKGET